MTTKAHNANKENTGIDIMAAGNALHIDFDALRNFHQGDSWFGCAVGFRAMQVAARELSGKTLWSREALSVVSGHPGAGVRDAIELVTASVSNERFALLDGVPDQGCQRNMRFEWWLCEQQKTLHIKLKDNFVPESFFRLLDRINAEQDGPDNRKDFDQMKKDLSDRLWQQTLDTTFESEFVPAPPTQSNPHNH